jgi:hypothetical protein
VTQPEDYGQHLYPNQHWSESQAKFQPGTDYAEPPCSSQYLPEFHAQPRPAGYGGLTYSGQGWPQFQPHSYTETPLPVQHRPEVHPAGFSDGDVPSSNAAPPEASTTISASHLRNAHKERTDPLSCLGDNQDGFTLGELYPVSLQVRSSSRGPTDPSRQQSVQTDYSPSSGRVKTNLGQTRRPQPYWTYDTRAFKHVNAVAGPSVVAHTPSVGSPTKQPYGRISETIADAVNEPVAEVTNNQTRKEENKAPVSNFYRSRIPRVPD